MGTVVEIEKNTREVIQAFNHEWEGRPLTSLHVFYRIKATGERKPTRKGLTFGRHLLPQLEAAIRTLRAEAEAEESAPKIEEAA